MANLKQIVLAHVQGAKRARMSFWSVWEKDEDALLWRSTKTSQIKTAKEFEEFSQNTLSKMEVLSVTPFLRNDGQGVYIRYTVPEEKE